MAIVQINIELRTKSFAGSYSHKMTLSILFNERDNSILDFNEHVAQPSIYQNC